MGKYEFVQPYSEEEKIENLEDRKKYYDMLKKKFENMQDPMLSIGAFLRSLPYPIIKFFLSRIAPIIFHYKVNIEKDETEPVLPEGPKIFISSHQHFFDALNVLHAISEPVIIMCSSDVPWWIKVIFRLSGVFFTERKNKNSTFNSKNKCMEYLAKGYNIVIFSEATYCGSSSKYLLSLYPGAFDACMKMDAYVVPIVQEYDVSLDSKKPNSVNECTVKFLHSFKVPLIIDRQELYDFIDKVRDQMATARHYLYERKYLSLNCSSNIRNDNKIQFSYENLITSLRDSIESAIKSIYDFEKMHILLKRKNEEYSFLMLSADGRQEIDNIKQNIDSFELTDVEKKELDHIVEEKYKISDMRVQYDSLVTDIQENRDLFLAASSRNTDMRLLTLPYRALVASQFATFSDMGVTCLSDELPAVHTKYYGRGLSNEGKKGKNASLTSPPINFVAWDPDTYELLDCGIKTIYFKYDLDRALNSGLKKYCEKIKIILDGSNINIYCVPLCDVSISTVKEEIINIISNKFPETLNYYNCSAFFRDNLHGIKTDKDKEKLETLIIPYNDYSIDHSKFSFEHTNEAVIDCYEKFSLQVLKEFLHCKIISENEYNLCVKLYYTKTKGNVTIFELVELCYSHGIISSRQRNKILEYIYYDDKKHKSDCEEHAIVYDRSLDTAYSYTSSISEKVKARRRELKTQNEKKVS